MPLFRLIARNPGDDSTYSFDENPDPKRFELVPDAPEPAPKKSAKPVPDVAGGDVAADTESPKE